MDPLFEAVDPVFKVEALTLRLTPFAAPVSRLILPVTTTASFEMRALLPCRITLPSIRMLPDAPAVTLK